MYILNILTKLNIKLRMKKILKKKTCLAQNYIDFVYKVVDLMELAPFNSRFTKKIENTIILGQ